VRHQLTKHRRHSSEQPGGRPPKQPQEIEDEDYERTWDRVAAVDVAKATGVVCTPVRDEDRPGRRLTRIWTVQATVAGVPELGDHLTPPLPGQGPLRPCPAEVLFSGQVARGWRSSPVRDLMSVKTPNHQGKNA
jgi:hypothetical protein